MMPHIQSSHACVPLPLSGGLQPGLSRLNLLPSILPSSKGTESMADILLYTALAVFAVNEIVVMLAVVHAMNRAN